MRRKTTHRLALIGLGAALTVGLATLGPPAEAKEGRILGENAPNRIAGSYIVVLKGEPSREARARSTVSTSAHELTGRYGGTVSRVYSAVLRGFAAKMSRAQAQRLAAHPAVKYVHQDGVVHTAGTQPNPPSWGLDRVDGEMDDSYTYPNAGSGVTVYVVDTGIRLSHQTFEGRAESGYDYDGSPGSSDCHGHGTHVAGTVGGKEYGVAKSVHLVAVRVLDCGGSGQESWIVGGIDWVTQNASGPSVANYSIGGGGSTAIDDAARNSVAAGVTWAVAAGNNGSDACNYSLSRVREMITVGATDPDDGRSSFSNLGTCLDLFAPGRDIISASNSSDTGSRSLSGTSMASPHVAGAAATYLSGHQSATPAQVQDAVVAAADEGVVGNPGSGSPNRLLNVTGLGDGEPPPPPGDPVARFTADCATSGLSCDFDASESSDPDGTIESYAWNFGDGETGSGVNPAHTYGEAGTYPVRLTVTDNDGKTNSTEKSVTVGEEPPPPGGEPPTASFSVSCSYETCSFDASTSSDPDGDIASYRWQFGDGSTGSGKQTSHRYPYRAADYTARLTVTDRGGRTGTTTHWVKCYPMGSRALCFQQD